MLRPCLTISSSELIIRISRFSSSITPRATTSSNLSRSCRPLHPNVRRLANPLRPFNYSALVNSALPHVNTPFVLMLNDDITVIDPDWLRALG
jgi:hypothetical protein